MERRQDLRSRDILVHMPAHTHMRQTETEVKKERERQ